MVGYATYTARDGTVFDLSDMTEPSTAGEMLWDSSMYGWGWSVDDKTGATSVASLSFDVTAYLWAEQADDFARHVYDDARDGGGTLVVNGWSLRCVIKTGKGIRSSGGRVSMSLSIVATDPTWRRITKHSLVAESGTDTNTTGLDYPTDYEFDYAGTSRGSSMQQFRADVPCSVRVTFFGPCQNPYVQVTSASGKNTSSNYYGVDASADAGERIVIDPMGRRSVGSSVYKVGAYGERTNLFDSRRRGVEGSGSYVFATMPAGDLMVSWPQGYAVDVETIEERGSLPWS